MKTAHLYKVRGGWELVVGIDGNLTDRVLTFKSKVEAKRHAKLLGLKPWNY